MNFQLEETSSRLEVGYHHWRDILAPSPSSQNGHVNFHLDEIYPRLEVGYPFPVLQTFQGILSHLEMVCPFPILQTCLEENQIDRLELNFHFWYQGFFCFVCSQEGGTAEVLNFSLSRPLMGQGFLPFI